MFAKITQRCESTELARISNGFGIRAAQAEYKLWLAKARPACFRVWPLWLCASTATLFTRQLPSFTSPYLGPKYKTINHPTMWALATVEETQIAIMSMGQDTQDIFHGGPASDGRRIMYNSAITSLSQPHFLWIGEQPESVQLSRLFFVQGFPRFREVFWMHPKDHVETSESTLDRSGLAEDKKP